MPAQRIASIPADTRKKPASDFGDSEQCNVIDSEDDG